jgi:hypothetical protein
MSKPQQIIISDFSGGISDSSRLPSANSCIVSKHFDIFTDPKRLIPYRSLEADTNDGSTATGMKQYLVKDYVYASASTKLYGLGQTGAGLTKIVYKADATTGNWTLPASSEGNGAVQNGCFVEYKDYLWGFQGTNQLFKWGTLSGTPSITNSVTTVGATITSVAQGIIAADANLYMFYNNVIVRIAPGLTVTDSAKTVPDNYKITSVDNYGNYLAIGCSPKNSYNGVSKTFIWNLSSDLFQETLDWGEGDLRVLANIEGMLIGVTDLYLNNATGAGKGSMVIKAYTGGTPQVLKEVFTQKLTGQVIPIQKVIKNNRLFWAAKIYDNASGTEYSEGLWSFGRKNAQYPMALSLDIVCESITTGGIQAIGSAANYFFIAGNGDGSIFKTDDTSAFSYTSIYESQIYTVGNTGATNQLLSFTIRTAPITAGSVTIKYKVDEDLTWTTIGTLSTVGELARDFYDIEATGVAFATFEEIRFRIEATGGVAPTGYSFIYQELIGSTG